MNFDFIFWREFFYAISAFLVLGSLGSGLVYLFTFLPALCLPIFLCVIGIAVLAYQRANIIRKETTEQKDGT